eukprot:gene24005-9578_t
MEGSDDFDSDVDRSSWSDLPTTEEPFALNDAHLTACVASLALICLPVIAYWAWGRLTRKCGVQQTPRGSGSPVALTPPPLNRLGGEDAMRTRHTGTPFSHERLIKSTGSPAMKTATPAWQGPATASHTDHGPWTVSKSEIERRRMERARRKDMGRDGQQDQHARLLFNLTPEKENTNTESREGPEIYQGLPGLDALRCVDPKAFSSLFSRRDLQDFQTMEPPRLLLLLDYLACCAITTSALAHALAPWTVGLATQIPAASPVGLPCLLCHHHKRPSSVGSRPCHTGGKLQLLMLDCGEDAAALARFQALPLLVWMLAQCWAFAKGHTSVLGMALGLYSVHNDETYKDHQVAATMWQMVCCAVVEAVVVTSSFHIGTIVSSLLLLANRRSLSQVFFGVTTVLEVSQPLSISRFPPSSSFPTSSPIIKYRAPR